MLLYRGQRQRAVLGLGAAALLVVTIPGLVGAQEGEPEEVDGNPKCLDLGYTNGFKIEATGELPDAGTYTVGDPGTETEGDAAGFEVTIAYASTDPVDFSFEANRPVDAVFVKAGPGGFLYTYDPPASSDSGLESPTVDSISHITFCWDGDEPPNGTTTTTTTTTTTSTTSTTSTTVPDGTTTTTVPGPKPPGQTTTTMPGPSRPGPTPPAGVPDRPGQAQPAPPIAGAPGFTG